MRFDELNLPAPLLRALAEMGYEELTPIQQQTLPPILEGKDVVALAETGSGKTAACAIPTLLHIDPADRQVQALIVVPTRELALQYVAEVSQLGKYMNVEAFAVYGGFSMDIQRGKLDHGVHILVATPGRLIDLLYNTPLRLSAVKTLALDEADQMLDQGFQADIEFICSCLVHSHQTLLFSATMPPAIKHIAQTYLNNPVWIELTRQQALPSSLQHWFAAAAPKQRLDKLMEIIQQENPKQMILFCSSRHSCQHWYDTLRSRLDSVECIHGGLDQNKRTSLFRRFKKMQIRFLVATDIAARGLDFAHTTHVVNLDFPHTAEAYTHRTGRTARMGREGKAITFFSPAEIGKLRRLIRALNLPAQWYGTPPDLDKSHKSPSSHRSKKSKRRRRTHKSTTSHDEQARND